jgi:hypothetical protein
MSWLKNNFKLEIYNKRLGEYIKNPHNFGFKPHYDGEGFLELFEMMGGPQKKVFGEYITPDSAGIHTPEDMMELVNYCIKKKYINKNWLLCAKWYLTRGKAISGAIVKNLKRPYLFRSIDPRFYRSFLRHGVTQSDVRDNYDRLFFEKVGIEKSDYIYADTLIYKAWEYAMIRKQNPVVIVVYKGKFFKWAGEIKGPISAPSYAWIKKNKEVSYKDTVDAVIRTRFVY